MAGAKALLPRDGTSADSSDEDFDADSDQDDAAENRSFSGKKCAEFFTDLNADRTDDKGDHSDDQGTDRSHQAVIFRNGKSHGQGINGCGNSLQEKSQRAEPGKAVLFFGTVTEPNSFYEHFPSDEQKEQQSNPWNKFLKDREIFDYGMDADPADHWHQKLKDTVGTGNDKRFSAPHVRFLQTIGHGNRKSIHCQSDTQKGAG